MNHRPHNSSTPCTANSLILAGCCGFGCANCGACACEGRGIRVDQSIEERLARLVAISFDIPARAPLTIN